MTTPAEIIVVRHLDSGIYKSQGGGESRVISRHASGPRGLRNALLSYGRERDEASRYYGSIGAGAGWIEIVPKGGEIGSGLRLPGDYMWVIHPASGAPLEWWQQQIAAHERTMQIAHDEIARREQAEYERMVAESC